MTASGGTGRIAVEPTKTGLGNSGRLNNLHRAPIGQPADRRAEVAKIYPIWASPRDA